ncbi:MAG: hypothetical protein EA416_13285 [Trueperaceae bacterium]|nr:MAG: hypothetical protein EA416_13285 [Trueperaceae bacterium]
MRGDERSWRRVIVVTVLAALVCIGAVAEEERPRLAPGLVPAGAYRLWCGSEVSPPDAVELAGRPAREVVAGETSTVVVTWTHVVRIRDDGSRGATVSGPTGCSATLSPGDYEVRVHESTSHHQWLEHPEIAALTRTPIVFRTTTKTWRVRAADFVPRPPLDEHPCDGTDRRSGLEGDEAEALRRAVASALASRGARVGPEHVHVYTVSGPLLGFSVYLETQTRQPRHTIDCQVAEHDAGNLELPLQSALHAVFGMVQEAGGRTRVTMRVIEIETSIVIDAGMGTVDGTGEAATTAAAHEAASQIGFDVFGW